MKDIMLLNKLNNSYMLFNCMNSGIHFVISPSQRCSPLERLSQTRSVNMPVMRDEPVDPTKLILPQHRVSGSFLVLDKESSLGYKVVSKKGKEVMQDSNLGKQLVVGASSQSKILNIDKENAPKIEKDGGLQDATKESIRINSYKPKEEERFYDTVEEDVSKDFFDTTEEDVSNQEVDGLKDVMRDSNLFLDYKPKLKAKDKEIFLDSADTFSFNCVAGLTASTLKCKMLIILAIGFTIWWTELPEFLIYFDPKDVCLDVKWIKLMKTTIKIMTVIKHGVSVPVPDANGKIDIDWRSLPMSELFNQKARVLVVKLKNSIP